MKTVKILAFSVAFAALAGCDSTEMATYEARSDEAFFETVVTVIPMCEFLNMAETSPVFMRWMTNGFSVRL